MSQLQHDPVPEVGQHEQPSDWERLMAQSSAFRMAPLQTEDRILIFMDDQGIMELTAQSFPGKKLTAGERAAKARKLVEEVRVAIAAAGDKVKPKLLGCTVESYVQALTGCASLDLSFSKALGQVCLVPYGRVATLTPMYQGFVTLIIRTGIVSSVQSEVVYKGELDQCVIENGQPIIHRKRLDCDRSDNAIVGVYAEARIPTGPPVNVILNRQDLDKIFKCVKDKDGPAKWWYGEWCKKTAVRRLYKQLPKTGDPDALAALARAIELDNRDYDLEAKEAEKGIREFGRAAQRRARSAKIVPAQPAQEPTDGPAEVPGYTAETVYRMWHALAAGGADDIAGHEKEWFCKYLSSLYGRTVENPRDLTPDDLAIAVADLEANHDSRPKDER